MLRSSGAAETADERRSIKGSQQNSSGGRDWALAREINGVVAKPSKMKTGCMCVMLTCLEGSHQNGHPTCPTNGWWNHDGILVSLPDLVHPGAPPTLTSGGRPGHVTEAQGQMGGSMLFCVGARVVSSLQVRTRLNRVEQVSSRFETCRDVVKIQIWGNGPDKAHVSCQDPSVDREDVCDSVCHRYSPFSTRSNEAWSSSASCVLVQQPSSRLHLCTSILSVPDSDLRWGLSALAWWEGFRSVSHRVGVTPGWN